MKSFIITLFILLFSFSTGIASDIIESSVSPPETPVRKWRIGYLEGGPWKAYQSTLIATVKALSEIGWIEQIDIPPQASIDDTAKLWIWLSANVKSKYLKFEKDALYSGNWGEEKRQIIKKNLLHRLKNDNNIDLMLAMGTWAGQDLANNDHSIPTVVGSSSDPLNAGIIKSADDSGYDHIIARIDPTRYERQIRAFHDLIGFKKLGVAFHNTQEGRSYAAIGPIKTVALERGFELIPCYINQSDSPEAVAQTTSCTKELVPNIDAYFAASSNNYNAQNLPEILAVLDNHRIPSFSQDSSLVKSGILISIDKSDFTGIGRFHARTIARILNGKKPRELNQVYEEIVKITFNAGTAIKIGLPPHVYNLLIKTAEKIYDEPLQK